MRRRCERNCCKPDDNFLPCRCCDSDDTCYDPNSWVARTATEHDHNGAPMTAASRILIMAFVAM
eukprot:scaffold117552_cov27-Tisochrysis_lutea.AAC.1